MKTLSKKLLSLLLVAVMLVAAMPFAAFADDGDVAPQASTEITNLYIEVDGTRAEVATISYQTNLTDRKEYTGADAQQLAAALMAAGTLSGNYTGKTVNSVVINPSKASASITLTTPQHVHSWKVIAAGATADKHVVSCDCGASEMRDHVWSNVTGAVAATHTAEGYTGDKHCTECGYEVKGTVIPKLTEHTFVDGVCACGAKQYSVTITVDGKAVVTNTSLVVGVGSTVNVGDAQSVLDALNQAYTYADYNSKSFDRNGITITIAMADKKSTTPTAKTVKITLNDGTKETEQYPEVGKYYSDYAVFYPSAQDGRTPESLKIEYHTVNADGKVVDAVRIVDVGTKTEYGKVKEGDFRVTIQWKAADRKINFYTDSTLAKVYKSLVVYSGKAIGELPTEVNGKAVEYWTVWGTRIYPTTTYNWTADAVNAVPHFVGESGKVYLEVYVNGNRTSKYAQVDITHKLQDGVIYRDTLLDTIRSATKNNSLKLSSVSYLFDESEWSAYVRNVNNTTTNTKIQIGENLNDARYVYVMVNGVTTKTTDPSNPKTGDSVKLGVAAAVLAVAVVGFGAVIVINKKKGAI